MSEPFDSLHLPIEAVDPDPGFAAQLRHRVESALLEPLTTNPTTTGATTMADTAIPSSADETSHGIHGRSPTLTPYLNVSDARNALDWYVEVFGAVRRGDMYVNGDGTVGHAEVAIGDAVLMLSEPSPLYPDVPVAPPDAAAKHSHTIHVAVSDVDATIARARDAGANVERDPTDEPYGRVAVIVDPFHHRWLLNQPPDRPGIDDHTARSEEPGFQVTAGPRAGERYIDGIWGAMAYTDPEAGIRFVTEVLGFEELVLVRDADGGIVHSEYRWPEGGIVQLAAGDANNPFLPPPGQNGLYVITQRPHAVWERCRAAGVEVIRPPEEPHYDPGGMGFSVRDPEGNAWSFGSYTGGATE